MARLFSILAICALAVFAVAGCGSDDDDSGSTTEATNAAATESGSDGDAMKNDDDADGDAMKKDDDADGDAMKKDDADGDAMKSDGDAMKKDDDAMKHDDDSMKHDGDEDSMKHEDDAMKKEASAGASASGDAMVANRKRNGKFVKAVGSQFGRVVADGKGEAFYLFDKENSKRSQCYGDCARAWPPVLTKGAPRAGKGVNGKLLGVTRRKNGKFQVTYKGHPLYYYVDDSPGTILCQNVDEFGGLWLVVKPNGNPVT